MAEGLFSGLGFQTPEQIRERISKKYQTEERARYERAAQSFAKAGSHAGRMAALGQQLGMTLRGAFGMDEEPDFSAHPEVQIAQQRQDLMTSIDLNDWRQVAEASQASLQGEDVAMGTWLADRAQKLKHQEELMNLEQEKLAAKGATKDWKYKHWSEGNRKAFSASLDTTDLITQLSDDQIEPAKGAIIGVAESIWNFQREQGNANYTMTEALNAASNFASNYVIDDWGYNSFDTKTFQHDASQAFKLERAGPQPKKPAGKKEPKKKVVRRGERRTTDKGDFIFIGKTGDDPNDAKNWKKIDKEAEKKKQGQIEDFDWGM